MMNEFKQFDLSAWSAEGVVFQLPRSRKRKAKNRKTAWHAVFVLASALFTGFTQESLRLPSDGGSTGVVTSTTVQEWKSKPDSIKDKGDLVTPEFWGEVRRYVSQLKPVQPEGDLVYPDPIV
jgi:hypothetical protein